MLLYNTFKASLELQLSILAVDYVHVMWVKPIICLNRTGRNSKILHRKSTRIITSNPFLWRTTCSRWICGRAKNSHGSCWWVRQIWQWSKGQTISAKFPSDCLGRILESCNWCLSPPRFQIKQNIFWWRNGKNQIYVFSFATISLDMTRFKLYCSTNKGLRKPISCHVILVLFACIIIPLFPGF